MRLAELETIGTGNKQSVGILEELGEPILRHAVEEEAIIMRIILHKAKEQAEDYQNRTGTQLDYGILQTQTPAADNMSQQQAKQKLTQFIQNLRNHFLEEEETMFPLALKGNSKKGL